MDQFSLDVRKFAEDQTTEGLVKAHRALILLAFERIVFRTPVDTGRARANWQVVLNEGKERIIRVRKSGISGEEATQRAMNQALRAASKIKPYSVAYITNNVPYIDRLENGSSSQAPSGMVAITIAELNRAIL